MMLSQRKAWKNNMIFLERLIEKYNTLLKVNKNFKEASNYSREFVIKVQLLEDVLNDLYTLKKELNWKEFKNEN